MNRFPAGKIAIALVVVMAIVASVGLWQGSQGGGSPTYTSPAPRDSSSQSSIPSDSDNDTITELDNGQSATFIPIVITGSGEKTSPPFTVTTDEWIIGWSFVISPEWERLGVEPVFGLSIYSRESGIRVEHISSTSGVTSGSTYSYAGIGDYYIKIIVAGIKSWEVTIRPPQ